MNGRFVAVVRDPSRRPSSAPPTPPRLREPETLAMLSHALNVDEVWRTHWRFVPTYFLMDNARAHDDSDILYPFPVPDTSGSGTPDSMPPLSSSWSLEAPSFVAEGNVIMGISLLQISWLKGMMQVRIRVRILPASISILWRASLWMNGTRSFFLRVKTSEVPSCLLSF